MQIQHSKEKCPQTVEFRNVVEISNIRDAAVLRMEPATVQVSADECKIRPQQYVTPYKPIAIDRVLGRFSKCTNGEMPLPEQHRAGIWDDIAKEHEFFEDFSTRHDEAVLPRIAAGICGLLLP